MSEMAWQERNKLRATLAAVFNDMASDQQPRQFFGVDANCFKLDGDAFEAVEDPDDGYRSSLDYVQPRDPKGLIFFPNAIDTVRLEVAPEYDPDGAERPVYGQFRGWVLRSVRDGHVWLWFGTDNSDDYYPGFVFRYEPRRHPLSPRQRGLK